MMITYKNIRNLLDCQKKDLNNFFNDFLYKIKCIKIE